ncbi:class I SAM-dependent methyltransferase [Thermaurantiacus tibetensis]|uniref:class I SAM-dependent methyltransferase n=1 Tax=Thermaurantiacus tibetensis TaxID=2759035 RepID=UPI001F1D24D3|nr:class I SAM-dependent methyltransferase [Thermaurantiacus tibetensis]
MVYNLYHEMLARPTGDELARQRFVLALKRHLMSRLRPGVAVAWEMVARPAFRAMHGRDPSSREEAEAALDEAAHYRYAKAINRISQEMMWQAVGETVYRELDRLESAATRLAASSTRRGSLTLDPAFAPDPVYQAVPIHLQPEGYCPPDPDGRSVVAGAFYESGGRLYSMGRGMAREDSKAGAVLAWLRAHHPGFRPRRMLDMGCSAGGASAAWAAALPECEVHAIDLGSSMLRYAHARAEALGVAVHFRQADAAATPYPDGHFDLVVSHNLFHEVSSAKRRAIAGESLRLLAPGGLALHQDVDLLFRGKEAWEEAERAYDLRYNNEPFWLDYATCDFAAELVEAGFAPEDVWEGRIGKTAGPGHWYLFAAAKPACAAAGEAGDRARAEAA